MSEQAAADEWLQGMMSDFLDEAGSLLSSLNEDLLTLETCTQQQLPLDAELMNNMFRSAHSLKGLGAAMGFDKIRDLTHRMETLFDHVRMGKRQLDPKSIETLFRVFDKLKELVQELSEPPAEPVTRQAPPQAPCFTQSAK